MENKYVLGLVALGLIGLLLVNGVSAFGFGNGFGTELSEDERVESQAQQEAIRTAIEENDYATWEGLMQERLAQMEDMINEEHFQEMVERNSQMREFRNAVEELRDSGDFSREAMKELATNYGIENPGKGIIFGPSMGMGPGMKEIGQGNCLQGGAFNSGN